MREGKSHKRLLFLMLIVAFVLILPATTLAQEVDDPPPDTCNPVMERLAEAMDNIDCEDLLDLLEQGFELGQVLQAAYVAGEDATPDDLEALILQKEEDDIGWGQFKIASRLANEDFEFEDLMEMRLVDGLGWGQIKKVQALFDAGADIDEAVGWMQQGLGWADIQAQLPDWESGPPPWANNDKEKGSGNNGNGPPPWSNAGGKHNKDGD